MKYLDFLVSLTHLGLQLLLLYFISNSIPVAIQASINVESMKFYWYLDPKPVNLQALRT
jgi:hypothetical protein